MNMPSGILYLLHRGGVALRHHPRSVHGCGRRPLGATVARAREVAATKYVYRKRLVECSTPRRAGGGAEGEGGAGVVAVGATGVGLLLWVAVGVQIRTQQMEAVVVEAVSLTARLPYLWRTLGSMSQHTFQDVTFIPRQHNRHNRHNNPMSHTEEIQLLFPL
jgi:hypothetical protein